MMPHHHQFMCKCICTFVVWRKRKFGTVQINAWISTVSSISSKSIQRPRTIGYTNILEVKCVFMLQYITSFYTSSMWRDRVYQHWKNTSIFHIWNGTISRICSFSVFDTLLFNLNSLKNVKGPYLQRVFATLSTLANHRHFWWACECNDWTDVFTTLVWILRWPREFSTLHMKNTCKLRKHLHHFDNTCSANTLTTEPNTCCKNRNALQMKNLL